MKKAFIQLHLAILLAGMTGIFVRLISLNASILVWYRVMIGAAFALVYFTFTHKLTKLPIKKFLKIVGVGCLLSLHWLFFNASIKASNVSIGVVCFSLVGFFTALLEPMIIHRKFSFVEVLLGMLPVIGIWLIFKFDSRYRTGILLGVVSSVIYVFFVVNNKKICTDNIPENLITYELVGSSIALTCLLPIYFHFHSASTMIPSKMDIIYLLLYSTIFTVLFHLLQLRSMKEISAFTVSISFNLESVYSIILAMIIFHEDRELNFSFYIGLSLIILSVLLQTFRVMKTNRQ